MNSRSVSQRASGRVRWEVFFRCLDGLTPAARLELRSDTFSTDRKNNKRWPRVSRPPLEYEKSLRSIATKRSRFEKDADLACYCTGRLVIRVHEKMMVPLPEC